MNIPLPDDTNVSKADIAAALRSHLGDDAAGLTDAQVVVLAVRRWIQGQVRAYKRKRASEYIVSQYAGLMAARESVYEAARESQAKAEAEADAAVDKAFATGT